jgi:hypothetical protein
VVLGLNFAGRDLLYAVSAGGKVTSLHHIGRIVLNVDATHALGFLGIARSVNLRRNTTYAASLKPASNGYRPKPTPVAFC